MESVLIIAVGSVVAVRYWRMEYARKMIGNAAAPVKMEFW